MEIDKIIEFDRIRMQWMNLAVTGYAKEKIKTEKMYLSENELRRQMRDTTNSRKLIELLGAPPLPDVDKIKEHMTLAQKGSFLTAFQLEQIAGILVSIKRLKDYLERGKSFQNPLAWFADNLDELTELKEQINQKVRGQDIDDHATRELFHIRTQIIKCEEHMKQKADQIMQRDKKYMADQYCTFRNGRLCIPVKAEYKLKISGSVIDRSATGSTLFMEPTSVSKYYEELQQLKLSEENEIYQILYTLTAMVSSHADTLYQDMDVIEKLDFIFSKGKLSIDLNAVEPNINTNRYISLKDARHPLMDPKINVPLQFETKKNILGIVITGPNTGGKTVAIKTVMLNCLMAQYGLHITCSSADVCMNSRYLCDIGDGQNLSENLSTFSSHIKNVLAVIREADRNSFVIMDELGSGTDPTEGMGIAIAILEELKKRECLFLVTTHYSEVKEYASLAENIVNARMTFDRETLSPTYQMIIGEAGESCAFYIAERLGMPNAMLRTAITYSYGEQAVSGYSLNNEEDFGEKKPAHSLEKAKMTKQQNNLQQKYRRGDSVMIFPDKKIGIVCEPVNERGVLRVQLPDKKIWINHKRTKLHVAASELYPEDYDFSIIFDDVKTRKMRHDFGRKYTEGIIECDE